MQLGGSGDIKIKLYLAVKELLGPEPINVRLRWETWVIHALLARDIPTLSHLPWPIVSWRLRTS